MIHHVFMQFVSDIAGGKWFGAAKRFKGNMSGGMDEYMMDHPYLDGDKQGTAKAVVNNYNNVNASFNMREQLEPDRVAFAVTEHLKKLVIDQSQGRGSSIHSGLVNR